MIKCPIKRPNVPCAMATFKQLVLPFSNPTLLSSINDIKAFSTACLRNVGFNRFGNFGMTKLEEPFRRPKRIHDLNVSISREKQHVLSVPVSCGWSMFLFFIYDFAQLVRSVQTMCVWECTECMTMIQLQMRCRCKLLRLL